MTARTAIELVEPPHRVTRTEPIRSTSPVASIGQPQVAVLFDFNGVVADDEPVHFQAFQGVLATAGFRMTAEEYRRYLGLDDRSVFEAFLAHHEIALVPSPLHHWVRSKQVAYDQLTRGGVHLFPGARELILALARAGAPLAIVSGARRAEIERVLTAAALDACFATIVGIEDVTCPKPDAAGYQLAFERLRARFHETRAGVAIEDAPAGVIAARAAGLSCIAVTTTCTPAELRGADRVIDSLKEIHLDVTACP